MWWSCGWWEARRHPTQPRPPLQRHLGWCCSAKPPRWCCSRRWPRQPLSGVTDCSSGATHITRAEGGTCSRARDVPATETKTDRVARACTTAGYARRACTQSSRGRNVEEPAKSTIQMPVGTPSVSQRCLHRGSHVRAGRVTNVYNPRQGASGALTSVRYSPTLKLKDVNQLEWRQPLTLNFEHKCPCDLPTARKGMAPTHTAEGAAFSGWICRAASPSDVGCRYISQLQHRAASTGYRPTCSFLPEN